MSMNPDRRQFRSRFFARSAAALACMLGGAGLLGWLLNNEDLKRIVPGSDPIKPNIALGILFCGGGLAILSIANSAKAARLCAAGAGMMALVLGTITLGEHFFAWNFDIDEWLLRVPGATRLAHPWRMSSATAFCFVLAGAALFTASLSIPKRLRYPLIAGLSTALLITG